MSAPALTLYDIEDQILALIDTGEGMDEGDPLREQLETELAHFIVLQLKKVDGVCRVLAHLESQAALAAAEIKRLQTRKQAFDRGVERLEAHVTAAMQNAGKDKLEGDTSTLKLQKNPASVFVSDFDAVPASYKIVKVDTSIDKAAVARALKGGVDVAGAELVTTKVHLVRK